MTDEIIIFRPVLFRGRQFVEFLARDSVYAQHTICYNPSVRLSHGQVCQKRLYATFTTEYIRILLVFAI